MQVVDKRDESPQVAFGQIERFAELVVSHRGENFQPRVTRQELASTLALYAIEPPFGGNTYILEYYENLLFVDCGLGCFEQEMISLLGNMFEGFGERRKSIVVTHPDIDSAGLIGLFDTVYVNRTAFYNYANEQEGRASYRERNPLHAPYNALIKVLSNYEAPQPGRVVAIGSRTGDEPLELIGSIRFGEWSFQVFEGLGGHSRGEAVITCPELKLAFTGDLYVNEDGMSDLQREFVELQPHLRASYDTKPELAARIRAQLEHDLAGYTICPGRGPVISPE